MRGKCLSLISFVSELGQTISTMRVLFLALAFTLVVAYVSACTSNAECAGSCPSGYPKECTHGHCQCHQIQCFQKSDCPYGHGTGCAANCDTSCVNNHCQCTCTHG
ncbi:hypothetical protein ACF0H5_001600 [Mactra antiquata]